MPAAGEGDNGLTGLPSWNSKSISNNIRSELRSITLVAPVLEPPPLPSVKSRGEIETETDDAVVLDNGGDSNDALAVPSFPPPPPPPTPEGFPNRSRSRSFTDTDGLIIVVPPPPSGTCSDISPPSRVRLMPCAMPVVRLLRREE
jgi:hypothetical protein